MKKKLDSAGGFTVVEMLCAVAVLVLLCLMLGTGLSMAIKTYRDITAESETQLLLNSLVDAIADELRYAHGAALDGTYNDGQKIAVDSSGRVYIQGGTNNGRKLLPMESGSGKGGAYHGGAYLVENAGDLELTYDKNTSCFMLHLKVSWKDGDISAETPGEGVAIRCLNPPKKEEETPPGGGTP